MYAYLYCDGKRHIVCWSCNIGETYVINCTWKGNAVPEFEAQFGEPCASSTYVLISGVSVKFIPSKSFITADSESLVSNTYIINECDIRFAMKNTTITHYKPIDDGEIDEFFFQYKNKFLKI